MDHCVDHSGSEKTFMMSSGNYIYKDHIPLYSSSIGVLIKKEILEEDMRKQNLIVNSDD